MPQYFFHIRDETSLDRDEFGIELPDMGAVRAEAHRTIAGFMMDVALGRDRMPGQAFEVADATGTCVTIIPFECMGGDRG